MANKRLTRGLTGSRMAGTKLRDEDVLEIRRLYDTESLPARDIGARFNLSTETIRRIGRRDSFSWIKTEEEIQAEMQAAIQRTMDMYGKKKDEI